VYYTYHLPRRNDIQAKAGSGTNLANLPPVVKIGRYHMIANTVRRASSYASPPLFLTRSMFPSTGAWLTAYPKSKMLLTMTVRCYLLMWETDPASDHILADRTPSSNHPARYCFSTHLRVGWSSGECCTVLTAGTGTVDVSALAKDMIRLYAAHRRNMQPYMFFQFCYFEALWPGRTTGTTRQRMERAQYA
jgi:hypothetical protein